MKLHNNTVEITNTGDINTDGYITGRKCGVFAYLTTPSNTTITEAGTYYPLNGTFGNRTIEDFTFVATPAIRYDGLKTQMFEVNWHATLSADMPATTVTIGIKKTGNLDAASLMSIYIKTAAESFTLGGVLVVELATNDTIQIVLTSDGSGDVISFHNFTTTIKEFYD